MSEAEVVVNEEEGGLVRQAKGGLGAGDHPPAQGRDMLPDRQIQTLNKSRVDLPAPLIQSGSHLLQAAKDQALFDPHQSSSAHQITVRSSGPDSVQLSIRGKTKTVMPREIVVFQT